jgi:hypothetical protein
MSKRELRMSLLIRANRQIEGVRGREDWHGEGNYFLMISNLGSIITMP